MKNDQYPRDVMEQCLQILLKKHKDYGPLNIAQAPGGAGGRLPQEEENYV